jgi:hypothetical protein
MTWLRRELRVFGRTVLWAARTPIMRLGYLAAFVVAMFHLLPS